MVDVATRFDEYVGKGVNDEFKHSLQILARAIREIWGYRSSRIEILTLSANIDAVKKKLMLEPLLMRWLKNIIL